MSRLDDLAEVYAYLKNADTETWKALEMARISDPKFVRGVQAKADRAYVAAKRALGAFRRLMGDEP